MQKHMLSWMVTAAILVACGGDDEPACAPTGTWTLTTTTTGGDCSDLGDVDTDALVVADARDAYTAQLVGPDGPVECAGTISASCSGELECTALPGVVLRLALRFDGDRASGTARLSADGECSSTGTVQASR